MRLSPVRQAILRFLAASPLPVPLEAIARADGVLGHCDVTTVYRTLMLFKAADLVRVVGFARKGSCFWLNDPGASHHFLICRECGRMVRLNLTPTTEHQIAAAAGASGFAPLQPGYEVHCVCPTCEQIRRAGGVPSKFPVGGRLEKPGAVTVGETGVAANPEVG